MQYSYLKQAQYIDHYKVKCLFEDGRKGILDLSQYLMKGGVFDKFKDESYARKLTLIDGVLAWGNGEIDIAPETVYHLTTKLPLPGWME